MDMLKSVSENVLDIEGSLRAEMKARLMTGKDINSQAIREAAMIAQTTGDYSKLSEELTKQVGSAEEFGKLGPMQQKAYADAFGMTTDGITEMLTKQQQHNEEVSTFGETGAKAYNKIKEGAMGFGSAMMSALPILAQSVGLMKNLGVGTDKLGGLFKSKKPAAPEVPGGGEKGGGMMKGMTDAIS
jgi:hypothetical protein